jgi:hypothetical protein
MATAMTSATMAIVRVSMMRPTPFVTPFRQTLLRPHNAERRTGPERETLCRIGGVDSRRPGPRGGIRSPLVSGRPASFAGPWLVLWACRIAPCRAPSAVAGVFLLISAGQLVGAGAIGALIDLAGWTPAFLAAAGVAVACAPVGALSGRGTSPAPANARRP